MSDRSDRVRRWLLWVVFVVAMPVPMVMPLYALVPAGRIFMLAGISTLTMFAETTRGAVVPLTFLFLLQGFAVAGALWVCAWGISKLLARVSPAVGTMATAAIVLAILAVTTIDSPFVDPYRTQTLRANLVQVYE